MQLIALGLLGLTFLGAGKGKTVTVSPKLLDGMWYAESSRQLNPKDGDKGKSIGPYQIQKVYWKDAVEFSKIGGKYEDCRDKEYSEKVIRAYAKRYSPDKASDEHIARNHNGGPDGHLEKNTIPYWNKVKKNMR